MKGGDKCADEGVGTSNFKSNTFKEYLEKLNSNFNINTITTGGFNKMKKFSKKQYLRKNKNISRKKSYSLKGSGYSSDPSEFIAGQPVYKKYDDCCPPAIIGGQLKFGGPDQPVCGFGAIVGGNRKVFKNKNNRSKSKKSKSIKNKNNKNFKRKFQKGGSDFNSIGNSKPAAYDTAFTGPMGVFKYPDDMKSRTFGETQPIWSANAL
jgi:hypothetical protein